MSNATIVIATAISEIREPWTRRLSDTFSVCEVSDWKALERDTANVKPGILVLDLALPGLGRILGLPHIQQLSPTTKTLVLSDNENEGEAISALKYGAKGYYTRSIDPASLEKAVEAVENGEMWVKRTLIPALVSGLITLTQTAQQESVGRRRSDRRLECLTHRQREVADAIAGGASNKEIASRLNVTERTVKSHLTEIFRNVGVLDRLHLALLLNNVPGPPFGKPGHQAAGSTQKNGNDHSPGRLRGASSRRMIRVA